MPAQTAKAMPAPVTILSANRDETDGAPEMEMEYSEEALSYAFDLIQSCLKDDLERVKLLVGEVGADCWLQDAQGWTSLHAAACEGIEGQAVSAKLNEPFLTAVGNVEMLEFLLRSGNAVWQIVDNLGLTAGDIAYSLNEAEAYDFLLQEGVRAELLRAVIESNSSGMDLDDADDTPDAPKQQLSTASDNATFLASPLKFVTDSAGQDIALDAEGNGVMMGWERDIMKRSAELICAHRRPESETDDGVFNVLNVGFGLGLVDGYIQASCNPPPTNHLIIEPHKDVLARARSLGWYDKSGVRFFEGTWREYLAALESGSEEYLQWDAVYTDTFSEHYTDLHDFFDHVPDLLRDEESKFSFFHGLGATSRLLYDVYTTVSELHLRDVGLRTEWEDVEVKETASRWEGTKDAQGEEKRYWSESVGPYRLPLCHLQL